MSHRQDGFGLPGEAEFRLSWPDLTGAGSVSTQLAPRRRVHLAGTPRQVDVSMTSSGVHGWSESRLPNRLPAVTRQALADMPRNGTGKLHVGIPLSLFDPNWQDGPIGKLIWHYRPDLMERRDVGQARRPWPWCVVSNTDHMELIYGCRMNKGARRVDE